jgi:iron complex outermembrane receptor protein
VDFARLDPKLALAAFLMDYTDVQIPGSVACVVSGVPTFCGVVNNAGNPRQVYVTATLNF